MPLGPKEFGEHVQAFIDLAKAKGLQPNDLLPICAKLITTVIFSRYGDASQPDRRLTIAEYYAFVVDWNHVVHTSVDALSDKHVPEEILKMYAQLDATFGKGDAVCL